MTKYLIATVVVLGVAYFVVMNVWQRKPSPEELTIVTSMKLTSPAYNEGQPIPEQYTCAGAGMRPVFSFSGVPAKALTLAFVFDDPDAPSKSFTHWLLWNIPPNVGQLGDTAIPAGATQGLNSAGTPGYVPPCPPSGTHRYIAHLFALDTTLEIPASSSVEDLTASSSGHILESATLTGTVGK